MQELQNDFLWKNLGINFRKSSGRFPEWIPVVILGEILEKSLEQFREIFFWESLEELLDEFLLENLEWKPYNTHKIDPCRKTGRNSARNSGKNIQKFSEGEISRRITEKFFQKIFVKKYNINLQKKNWNYYPWSEPGMNSWKNLGKNHLRNAWNNHKKNACIKTGKNSVRNSWKSPQKFRKKVQKNLLRNIRIANLFSEIPEIKTILWNSLKIFWRNHGRNHNERIPEWFRVESEVKSLENPRGILEKETPPEGRLSMPTFQI